MTRRIIGNDEARLMSYVEKTPNCWLFTGAKGPKGYGAFWYQKRVQAAHRASFQMFVGPIAEGMQIDHTCYTPECVRPEHLRAATHKENQENRSGARYDSSSGIRGVYFMPKSGKWRAEVRHNGRCHSAGHHATIQEAEAAVIALRLELFTHNDIDRRAA